MPALSIPNFGPFRSSHRSKVTIMLDRAEKPYSTRLNQLMFIRTSYLRRLTSSLAILVSLIGSLQQSHAFCHLTECGAASDQEECQACRDGKSCCLCQQCQEVPAIDSVCCGAAVADGQPLPCQDSCWCCRASEPISLPKDGSSSAEELLASSALFCADYLMSVPIEHLVASFDNSEFRELDILSAAQFCVQLCRFRI